MPSGGVHFRVWAPHRKKVDVNLDGQFHPLKHEKDGYYSGLVKSAGVGSLYKFRLDGGDSYPDPASRFQPDGPHGFSQVVDPGSFAWSDNAWRGAGIRGQIVYELHIGTFTKEGTFASAVSELPATRRRWHHSDRDDARE